jgi:TonB family protein
MMTAMFCARASAASYGVALLASVALGYGQVGGGQPAALSVSPPWPTMRAADSTGHISIVAPTASVGKLLAAADSSSLKSVPLGPGLERALEKSSLTGTGAQPFHLKASVEDSMNPSSDYRAEIDEDWAGPKQWRRTIDSKGFQQTIIVNGNQVSEKNNGDYYPLWLQNFIRAVFEPVPNVQQWESLDAKLTQTILPNGQRMNGCVGASTEVGTETLKSTVYSDLCLDGNGMLAFYNSPGYSMEFYDYKRFGKKTVARRYENHPNPGLRLVAQITLLDELKDPNPSSFAITEPTSPEKRLLPIGIPQSTLERAILHAPPMVWPPVHSGGTSGMLTMYISIDRNGRIREIYPLNSDNAELEEAAREHLLQWRLKQLTVRGNPVQAESTFTVHFDTNLLPSIPAASVPADQSQTGPPIQVSAKVAGKLLVSHPPPVYPQDALLSHLGGTVVLELTVDREGIPRDIHVLSTPGGSLSRAAVDVLRQAHYRPYLVNGRPMEIQSTVSVDFTLQ